MYSEARVANLKNLCVSHKVNVTRRGNLAKGLTQQTRPPSHVSAAFSPRVEAWHSSNPAVTIRATAPKLRVGWFSEGRTAIMHARPFHLSLVELATLEADAAFACAVCAPPSPYEEEEAAFELDE